MKTAADSRLGMTQEAAFDPVLVCGFRVFGMWIELWFRRPAWALQWPKTLKMGPFRARVGPEINEGTWSPFNAMQPWPGRPGLHFRRLGRNGRSPWG